MSSSQATNTGEISKPSKETVDKNRFIRGYIQYPARAKYYPTKDGKFKLAMLETFSTAKFAPIPRGEFPDLKLLDQSSRSSPAEDEDGDAPPDDIFTAADERDWHNIERAIRRAQLAAFDVIMCNYDMNWFGTLTYGWDFDEASRYVDVYTALKIWLSNRVQRYGFKYLIVPEYHKSGRIHFHMISNNPSIEVPKGSVIEWKYALDLAPAENPQGRAIYRNHKRVYNITAWRHGYSTAMKIGDTEEDRIAVAKYLFKYMKKQNGQKIGGRYFLKGGELLHPSYAYGSFDELKIEDEPVYSSYKEIGQLVYHKQSFI